MASYGGFSLFIRPLQISGMMTFEEVQAVFLEWMNRLSWVIENKGEYFIK
jgi:hypothetical protein